MLYMTLAFARQFELVLSSVSQEHKTEPSLNNILKNKCKIMQQLAKLPQVECVPCLLTFSNMPNAKRQSMDVCLDLPISTNRVTKKTDEALISN